jgi:hypothetical protein
MGWIFPMAAVVHRCRRFLSGVMSRWAPGRAFWVAGWVGGLLTEFFAVLANREKLPADRVLMHPDPWVDLVFGVFYYGFFMGLWLLLRRRWAFSKTHVFLVSGLFGLATEQGGAILAGVASPSVLGVLLAVPVMCVYGIFPTLALLLTETRWPVLPRPGVRAFAVTALGFFFFWAFYGLVIHRGLLAVFPKAGLS